MKKKQQGYTLFELVIGLIVVSSFVLFGFGMFVISHFVMKFW